MRSLPIFLDLRGRRVILIGAGEVAAAKRRLLERAGADVVADDHADAALAIVCDDAAAADRLRARGVLVNAVDDPARCDFTLPAIVERDPVLIAIGTSGVSAGLAAALRQRLEALLPARLGALAHALRAARPALAARHPDPAARRRALAALLAAGGPLDPLVAHPDPAAALAQADAPAVRLERVGVRSPDPDELTLRAARLLAQADRVHHPADMAPAILDRARADAARIVGPAAALPGAGLVVELRWERA